MPERDGHLLTPPLLGYDRDEDGYLVLNEAEAHIVKFIFDAYLAGMKVQQIATLLTDIGCPTKKGSTKWDEGALLYILKNERYCGLIRTWKTFTYDILEHKKRKNDGDREQFVYKGPQEAIITREQYEAVQCLIENRRHHVRGGLPVMHVIDDGVFHGFVPINHHWINDDPTCYYEASNGVERSIREKRIRKADLSAFNLDGYQVVRGQFLTSRAAGPSISITNKRIMFNSGCLRKFKGVPYVQLLLHPVERKIAIRPCGEADTYSIRWHPNIERVVTSKAITCEHFATALFQIMDWSPDYTYRIRGIWASNGSNQIIVFNLKDALTVITCEVESTEDSAAKKKQFETFPEEWGTQFGADFYEHSIQNEILLHSDWKAETKSRPVKQSEQISLLSPDELQCSIEHLRVVVGGTSGINE